MSKTSFIFRKHQGNNDNASLSAYDHKKTMDDMYGDGSDHEVCEKCGMCKHCGDCDCAE